MDDDQESGQGQPAGPGILATHGPSTQGVTLDAVTTLVHSFGMMVTAMEARITTQIQNNAVASKERWGRWETEFKEYRTATDRRIEILEVRLDGHLRKEEREDLIIDARIRPLRTTAGLLAAHWRTLAIVVLSIAALAGVGVDLLQRIP